MTPAGRLRNVVRLLAALGVVLLLGAASRLYPVGIYVYDKSLGDVLYAVAAYLALALVLYRVRPAVVAPAALAACAAVECFKLTGLPARYAGVAAVRWLLGTSFSWHNLACYAAGVAPVALSDAILRRVNRRGETRPPASRPNTPRPLGCRPGPNRSFQADE